MDNKTLEESILTALEGTDIRLLEYLPYILQDFWELGSFSEEIVKIIKKYKTNYSSLNVLDLGSGKGAVSVKIASKLKCNCLGIDGLNDFVNFSNNKSKEYSVNNICTFEKNDIRTRIKTLGKYDIILSLAIGPVFGNFYDTLIQFSPNLKNDGLIVIHEAYAEDGCNNVYSSILQKNEISKQVNNAGMELIEIIKTNEISGIEEKYKTEFNIIQKRCMELVEKYPQNKELFLRYIEGQKTEYEILSNEIVPAIFVIKKKV